MRGVTGESIQRDSVEDLEANALFSGGGFPTKLEEFLDVSNTSSRLFQMAHGGLVEEERFLLTIGIGDTVTGIRFELFFEFLEFLLVIVERPVFTINKTIVAIIVIIVDVFFRRNVGDVDDW